MDIKLYLLVIVQNINASVFIYSEITTKRIKKLIRFACLIL